MNEYDIIAQRIAHIYHDEFPNSKINQFYGFDKTSIFIRLFIVNDRTEAINQIFENDLFHIVFEITKTDDGYTLECHDKTYTTNPTNSYCVYGHKSLKFRIVKGSGEKIYESFSKFVKSLKSSLVESLNNGEIHTNHIEILTKKLRINVTD